MTVDAKLDALTGALSQLDDGSPEFEKKETEWTDSAKGAFEK